MDLLLKNNGNEGNSPKSRTTANLKLLPFPLPGVPKKSLPV